MTSVQAEGKPNYLWRQLRLLQKEVAMSGEDQITERKEENYSGKPEKVATSGKDQIALVRDGSLSETATSGEDQKA